MPTQSKFKGHVILTKAQYCALATRDENKQYFITDLPNGSISNADMALALTTESMVYSVGSIFRCLDNGTYDEGKSYKFCYDEIEDEYSWELVSEVGLLDITSMDPQDTYFFSSEVNNNNYGYITGTNDGDYPFGSSISLTAVPESGYEFVN